MAFKSGQIVILENLEQAVFQRVDPKRVILDRITGAIASVFFCGLILIGMLILTLTVVNWSGLGIKLFSMQTFSAWCAACFLITAIVVFNFVWPSLKYNRTFWRLSEDGLEIRRGVVWRHQISVPRARVQHADVVQGPLQRHYGVATLIVHTAGTQNSSVGLVGLTHATAVDLRDELIRQGKEIHVV